MREWSGMFCHSADPQCTITERFTLGCSWLCRKDVRRARKMTEKKGQSWWELWSNCCMSRNEKSQSSVWQRQLWRGGATHRGCEIKHRDVIRSHPLLCLLLAAESLSAAAPSQGCGCFVSPVPWAKGSSHSCPCTLSIPPQQIYTVIPSSTTKATDFSSYFPLLLAIQWCFNWGCWVVKSTVTTTKSRLTGSPLIFLCICSVISAQWGENTFSKEKISTALSISIAIFAGCCLQNGRYFFFVLLRFSDSWLLLSKNSNLKSCLSRVSDGICAH